MANKDWTLEEAQAANKAALLEKPERSFADPSLPLFQWHALRVLDHLHAQYERGEKFALMQALRQCANHGLIMPPWVANAYIKGFDHILNYKSKDWNEVFGSPIPKGANLEALRKKRILRLAVYTEAVETLKRDPKRAIDAWLFEEVGEKFSIGKTKAEEYCREAEKLMDLPLKEAKNPMKL